PKRSPKGLPPLQPHATELFPAPSRCAPQGSDQIGEAGHVRLSGTNPLPTDTLKGTYGRCTHAAEANCQKTPLAPNITMLGYYRVSGEGPTSEAPAANRHVGHHSDP